ncbi:hypothetical protein [Gemella sp. zg-1178]|uniref:hypothetical protein n=1 Tax=Gemella sp. zg-1178 TaxID=2840372 RepID=UPI001C053EB7|nr:hypothetical protein [Gemella sp. zg-1178]MBU0279196.1 hypothetical protein [Gemella sp. zg-1178]
MKTKDLITYNNELRNKLSEENNKKYEELLIKIRFIGFFKNQEKLEETLLEILQDLIEAQKNGKHFEDIFGNDIDLIAKNIIENSSQDSFSRKFKNIVEIIMMFFLPSFFINLVGKEDFDLVTYAISGIFILIIILASLYLVTSNFYKKNKILVLMILSILIFLALLAAPLLIKYDIINLGISYHIKVTPTILISSYLASILAIIYARISFNEIILTIIPTIFAVISILSKNNLNHLVENKNLFIFSIILIIISFLLTILLSKKFLKTKK